MRPLTYRDLKRALGDVAKRVEKDKVYKKRPDLAKANKAAASMFGQVGPVWRVTEPRGPRRNITALSLWRTNRLLRRHGVDWPLFDWDALIKWLYENWDQVLRTLLSLLALVIL